ncbi:MAG TPA: GGDEF domain-containing protein [Bacillota bacterium]|nr:GGDEF domain-containing protein [Bacillota bacterium]
MNKLFSKSNRIMMLLLLLITLLIVSGMFFSPFGSSGVVLTFLVGLVSLVGVLGSHVIALGLTLLLFFILGSILFWLSMTQTVTFLIDMPYVYILVWMVLLIIVAITSGRISMLMRELEARNLQLNKHIETLVAIDPVTGFDNKDRFFIELELEHNRAKRYGNTFTLILFKVNYLESFQKMYGKLAYDSLFQTLAAGVFKSTRVSDKKFRIADDTFGLILPDTDVANVAIVEAKLENELAVYQLENKQFITLSFEFGSVGFEEEREDYMQLYERAKEKVQPYVS